MSTQFPPGFVWGTATAAAQIEGAARADGRSDSIWDVFARRPGAIAHGDTPAIACDHYGRMRDDVGLLRALGVDAYRFSVSWSRVLNRDAGLNQAGVDFYSRLVDELLDAGIQPWLTLYHWDLPQSIEGAGGWTSRDTAKRFRDYAMHVHEALGDRVSRWTTFNEPFCSALLGYAAGVHAPGRTDPVAGLAAVHHQHLAHGMAVEALRSAGAEQVGITLNLSTGVPLDRSDPADIRAAEHFELVQNRIFLDPLLTGAYPALAHERFASLGLHDLVHPGDGELISQPIDFLGVNYYHDDCVSGHPPADETATPWIGGIPLSFPRRNLPRTAMGWEVNPDGIRQLLLRLGGEYPNLPPLYVTENGAAYDDTVGADGSVHDDERTRFVLDHVEAVRAAIHEGADVRGYFVWSLLDNFEWAFGYEKRFGIVRVDYDTLERTPKVSALAYADLIRRSR